MNPSTTHDADPVLPGPLPPDHLALSVAKYPGQERYQVWVSVDGHEIVEISAYRTRAAADAARQRIADHRATLAISPTIVTHQDVVDALVPLYQSEEVPVISHRGHFHGACCSDFGSTWQAIRETLARTAPHRRGCA